MCSPIKGFYLIVPLRATRRPANICFRLRGVMKNLVSYTSQCFDSCRTISLSRVLSRNCYRASWKQIKRHTSNLLSRWFYLHKYDNGNLPQPSSLRLQPPSHCLAVKPYVYKGWFYLPQIPGPCLSLSSNSINFSNLGFFKFTIFTDMRFYFGCLLSVQ